MQTKQLRGILIAVGFVFAINVGYTSLTRAMPSGWAHSIQPPFAVMLTMVPIAIITFFAARFIPLHAAVFGAIAFGVTFFVFAGVFGWRGLNDSLDVPFLFAVVETIAYLVGFLGHEFRQQHIQQKHRAGQ